LKHRQPGRRLDGRLAIVDETDAVAGTPRVDGDGHGRATASAVEQPADATCVAEVVRHQRFDLVPRGTPGVAERVGEPLLHLVRQRVVIAPVREVQHRPDPEEEVLRVRQARGVFRAPEQRRVGDGGNRPDGRDVAQPAGRFLDVRFELVERAVETGVASVDQVGKRAEYVRVRRRHVKRGAAAIEQDVVARHQAGIGQRQQELRVVHLELRQLVDLAHLLADGHPRVPQRMQDRAETLLLSLTDRAAEQDEDVEVGIRTQMTPSVAAQRDHRQLRRRLRRALGESTKIAVDEAGVALERRSSARATENVVADLPPGLFQSRASLWC
jgi:hypothetical protein